MKQDLIGKMNISKPQDWFTIEIRANIAEVWDLVEDLKGIPKEIRNIAFQEIFREQAKRTFKELDKREAKS
jgi:hypothetical protein